MSLPSCDGIECLEKIYMDLLLTLDEINFEITQEFHILRKENYDFDKKKVPPHLMRKVEYVSRLDDKARAVRQTIKIACMRKSETPLEAHEYFNEVTKRCKIKK